MDAAAPRLAALVELAGRACEGGDGALEALLRQSAGIAHAVARARLGDGHAAEEAAVEALARVARGLPRLRDPQAYPRWLCRIAARCAATSAWRRPLAAAGPAPERADPAPGPFHSLVAAEGRRAVREAVDALPRRLKEVVLLHFVEDLSYRDVAAATRCGLGTVARRMAEALARLRKTLGGEA